METKILNYEKYEKVSYIFTDVKGIENDGDIYVSGADLYLGAPANEKGGHLKTLDIPEDSVLTVSKMVLPKIGRYEKITNSSVSQMVTNLHDSSYEPMRSPVSNKEYDIELELDNQYEVNGVYPARNNNLKDYED